MERNDSAEGNRQCLYLQEQIATGATIGAEYGCMMHKALPHSRGSVMLNWTWHVQVSVLVGSQLVPMSVTIIESLDIDFLFGLDMLRRYRCCIDLETNCLRFGTLDNVSLSFLPEHELPRRKPRQGPQPPPPFSFQQSLAVGIRPVHALAHTHVCVQGKCKGTYRQTQKGKQASKQAPL